MTEIYETIFEFFLLRSILNCALICALMIFSIYFYMKRRKKERKSLDRVIFIGTSLWCFCYGLTRIFFLFSDFEIYNSLSIDTSLNLFLTNFAYSSAIFGTICVVYAYECTILRTRYIFTIVCSGILVLSIFAFIFNIPTVIIRPFLTASLPVCLSILFLIFVYLAIKTPTEYSLLGGLQAPGQMRKRAMLMLSGLTIFLFGMLLDSKIVGGFFESLGLLYEIRISITPLILLVGGAIFTFSQQEAIARQAEIKGIFIISQDGRCMVKKSYKDILIDPDLITSIITGINSILKESIASKKALKAIYYEDVKILLDWGIYVNSAIIVDKETSDLRKNLENFLNEFEQKYKPHITQWTGDIDIFSDANDLIEIYFKDYI